jgi:Fe2+ or Zn2+ uptake regulation protein
LTAPWRFFIIKIENDFQYRKEVPVSDVSQNWFDSLLANGYRLTGSRRTVVEIVASSRRALTPLEVYEDARRRHPGLGLVTVYRTLEKLEELHLIQRVHQPAGCQAFIAAFHGHEHLILCSRCGKVVFFEGDDLEALINRICAQTGFEVQEHWLQLFGLCASCRETE